MGDEVTEDVAETGMPVAELIRRSPTLGEAMDALSPAADLLERVFYDDASMTIDEDTISMWVSLLFDGQISFDLPEMSCHRVRADSTRFISAVAVPFT